MQPTDVSTHTAPLQTSEELVSVDGQHDDTPTVASLLDPARRVAQRGMTIIEIMVVVAIIGIIGTAIAFGATALFGDAQAEAAKTQISSIAKGLDVYYLKHREYPDNLQALVEEGKIKEKQLKDPWKQDFVYNVVSARKYELCSAGEDKSSGTADDVCND